ncbi:MAG: hypothetical protein KGI51_09520 [Rhodospirillales bacterium]|nr:hypothetical protein [Rhodospirillales bacterium]
MMPRLSAIVLSMLVAPMLITMPALLAAPPVANAPILPGFGAVTAPQAAPQPPAPPATSPPEHNLGTVPIAGPAPATGEQPAETAAPPAPGSASDYMALAAQAVAAKQADPALRALGRAETRLISRSVPLFQTNTPIADPAVTLIRKARQAVAAGDFAAAATLIQQATPVVAQEEAHPAPAPPVGLPTH